MEISIKNTLRSTDQQQNTPYINTLAPNFSYNNATNKQVFPKKCVQFNIDSIEVERINYRKSG